MEEEENQKKLLKFWISNKTQNITLKYHRRDMAFQSCPDLAPVLPPGSSDSCEFFRKRGFQGCDWLVVYEAEPFTLAVFLLIPWDPTDCPSVLHLELSRDKAHLGDLGRALCRAAWLQDPPDPDGTAAAHCVFSHYSGGKLTLLSGPYKVTAHVSHHQRSILEVQLEERGRS